MIGTLGGVIFTTSSFMVLTPKNMQRSVASRWAKHELIAGKPKTQYIGADLQSFTFEMTLKADYGVRPRLMLEILSRMCESPLAYPLIIGGRPVGDHNWRVVSVSESYNIVYNFGEVSSATVQVSLEEYV